MKVSLIENEREWKDFVNSNKDSAIQYSLEFKKCIENTYKNCESKYFIIRNKKVEAVFPLFILHSKIFGKRAISMPFLDNGGFLGQVDSEAIAQIIGELKEENLRSIEIRTNSSFSDFNNFKKIMIENKFEEDTSRQQIIVKLQSESSIWKKFNKHTRNDIRKATKSNLRVEFIKNEKDLRQFYNLYFVEMKNFGTPQHSYKFFENLMKLDRNFVGFNCYHENRMIGSLIMLYENKKGYIVFNVSRRDSRGARPNDILYWEAIKYSIRKKMAFLDLGQIEKDSLPGTHAEGLYKFKRKWLGDIYERVYFTYFFGERKDIKKEKNSYKKLRNIWRKLPMFFIKLIGPKICSELGI